MFSNNRLFILELVKINGLNLQFIPNIFRNDKEIVFQVLKNQLHSFVFASEKIKDNKDKFDVVEAGIDDIIKKVKEVVEPISSPIVAGMKLIPFGNPSERLQELADDLKLKMDGIDLSELEKIPDLSPEITIRVKALPQKVKDKKCPDFLHPLFVSPNGMSAKK